MITPKTPAEISLMAEGGRQLAAIREKLLSQAQVGVSLMSLEQTAEDLIRQAGGSPSFQTVKGYKWATCLCVNEVVVHGIPIDYVLKEGDLLTIDIGMLYQGFHTDTAWTKVVHGSRFAVDSRTQKFLKVGEEALEKAIGQARVGNRVGHISQVIQKTIAGAGFSVVKSLVGHGVGRALHEPPQIPGFLRGKLEDTPPLLAGMTLAIEVIYAAGKPEIYYPNDDGWSIATRDKSLTAVFEHTIAVTDDEPLVLTQSSS